MFNFRPQIQPGNNFGSLGATRPVAAPFMGQINQATVGQGLPPQGAPAPVMGMRPLNNQM